MLRRQVVRLRFASSNPDTDPALGYSMFHWNYLMPQIMLEPQTVNRQGTPPKRRGMNKRAFNGVWIDVDMHPAFRVALDPYLRKLPLTRAVPATKPSEAVKDYTDKAPLVGDVRSRHGWLAKVAQLCGMHKEAALVLPVWAAECHEMYVKGDAVPSTALGTAMTYCTAVSHAPEWRSFFQCCLKDKWNITPTFTPSTWSQLLQSAGMMEDEDGVLAILDEITDLQVNVANISNAGMVHGLNAVRTKEGYERVKKFLYGVPADKVKSVQKAYIGIRSKAEIAEDESFKENDNMFYHVHWHASIRHPMPFLPRRLFFDYKPANAVEDQAKFTLKSAEKILEERLKTWKEQGLVPEDYVDETKVDDKTEKFMFWRRQEKWKKKDQKFMERDIVRGYTPYEATK